VQGVYHGYSEFLSSQFLTLPVFLVVIGSIIFFVAFFGCFGAMKENYCMILTVCSAIFV
jgi:CD63 antigen